MCRIKTEIPKRKNLNNRNFYYKSQVCNRFMAIFFKNTNVNINVKKCIKDRVKKLTIFSPPSIVFPHCIYEKPAVFMSWRFLHSINTERLHRRAGKPRLSRHSEWEILQNGSEALFYISFLFPPFIPFPSLLNLPSLSGEKRSRFRTMRKRCTCKRIDVSPSSMTTAAATAAASSLWSSSSSLSSSTSTQPEERLSVARPRNYRSGNPRFRSSSVLLRRCCLHRHHRHRHRRHRHHRRRCCRHHRHHHHHYRPPVTAAAAAVAATVMTMLVISWELFRFYLCSLILF